MRNLGIHSNAAVPSARRASGLQQPHDEPASPPPPRRETHTQEVK